MKNGIIWTITIIFSTCLLLSGCGGNDAGGNSDGGNNLRVLAKNVVFRTAVANAATSGAPGLRADTPPEVDVTTRVLAENVVYSNAAGQSDIAANNVEDALTETNVGLGRSIVGKWNVTNIGKNKTGVVTFREDGTYTIESGYFEGGGSFLNYTDGTYFVRGDVIAFTYTGWDTSTVPVSRLAIVFYKKPHTMTISTQGHSHGVEVLDRIIE